MTWDRQNCEDCLLDDGCQVDGVACSYIRTLRAQLKDIKDHIKVRPKSIFCPPMRDSIASIGCDDKAVYKWMIELEERFGDSEFTTNHDKEEA